MMALFSDQMPSKELIDINDDDDEISTRRRRRLPKHYECYVLESPGSNQKNHQVDINKRKVSGTSKRKKTMRNEFQNNESKIRELDMVYGRHKTVKDCMTISLTSNSMSHAGITNKVQNSRKISEQTESQSTNKRNIASEMSKKESSLERNIHTEGKLATNKIGRKSKEKVLVKDDNTLTKPVHVDENRELSSPCRSSFDLAALLKEQSLIYGNQEEYSSEKRDSKSDDSRDNNKHPVSHCISKPYKCQSCSWSFNRKYSLSQHMKHYHRVGSQSLRRTQPVRMGKSVCEICGKIIQRFSQLQIHLRSHTGEKAFFCDICHRGFNVACNYRRHLLRHGKQKFQCSQCKKQYFEKRHLDIHISKMHLQPKHDVCQITSPADTGMSNETNKRLNCQYCSKRYTAKEGLSRHLQHNHIPCKECGKVCRNHSEYKIHQLVHTSYRPFLCKMCGKGFKCKTSLDHHILCHTDYMPYSCLVCDKKFRQPQGLWRHKKYHQTEKPHVCNVCSKAFCHKADLKRHSKIHEPKTQSHNNRPLSMVLDRYLSDVDQAKTWICTVCQSHFSEFAELEKHICKPVGETSKDIESSAGVSVMKLIGNDAMESETVTQTVVTAQGCQLLLEQHSDVSPPEIENETASAPPSLTVRLTENPNGISEMNDLEHCVSEPGSGLIKFSETFLGSVHFEQEPTLNSRLEDLIVLHKGTSKLATPQVTDNARDSVCLVHKDSPNVVLAKDNVHSELKDQDLLTTNHLIYVIMPSQSDELINGDEVCINQVINASGGDRLMSQDVLASVSESQCLSSPVEGSTAEKLMRVGSCVVSKGQNIQYGQSLLTGKKVPLNKTLEIFPSHGLVMTQSNLDQIQNIVIVSPDNLLSETEQTKVNALTDNT